MDQGAAEKPKAERHRSIYLVRHGEIRSEKGGKRYIGHIDLPLSRCGIRQAEELRERLRPVALSAVYCSDLERSLVTADIIAEPHRLRPIAKKGLREIFLGDWEGLTFAEVRRRYPEAYRMRGEDIVHYRPLGGESFLDCAGRVLPAFAGICRAGQGDIVVVGHAGVNRILLCDVLGIPLARLFSIPQEYGCVNLIQDRNGRLSI